MVPPSASVATIRPAFSARGETVSPHRSEARRRNRAPSLRSAATRCRFSIMCANGSPGSISPPKLRNAGRVASVEPAVGDHHVEDRLRLPANGVPDADRLEQPPCGGDNRGRPFVASVAPAQRRIGDRHGKRRAERLPQRDRKREAGKVRRRQSAHPCRSAWSQLSCSKSSTIRRRARPRGRSYAKNADMYPERCSVKRAPLIRDRPSYVKGESAD